MFEPRKEWFHYKTDHRKGFGHFSYLEKYDICSILEPLLNAGYYVGDDDRITKKSTLTHRTPWSHIHQAVNKDCGLWHGVLFNYFKFIPKGCHECWKVVVRPRTLTELFKLEELEKGLCHASKCGIEVRHYTPAHYGGYFYNNSLDEGRACYEMVRKAVDEHISKDIAIILKRGCTEMELFGGPSPYWAIKPEDADYEDFISERLDVRGSFGIRQPDYMKIAVHKRWIQWAYNNNDKTYLEYTGGRPLYAPAVQYQDGDIGEIKNDIIRARSESLGIPKENADKIQAAFGDLGDKGIPFLHIAAGAGLNGIHKMCIGEGMDTHLAPPEKE